MFDIFYGQVRAPHSTAKISPEFKRPPTQSHTQTPAHLKKNWHPDAEEERQEITTGWF
jgi:hypothetical protein